MEGMKTIAVSIEVTGTSDTKVFKKEVFPQDNSTQEGRRAFMGAVAD
jgi:hypothetical protein